MTENIDKIFVDTKESVKSNYSTRNIELESIEKILNAWSCWKNILTDDVIHTKNSNISSILCFESEYDAKASINLALSGYFKHANICLRSCLDLTVMAIHFETNYGGYVQWMMGQRKTPGFQSVINSIFDRSLFKQFNDLTQFKDEIIDLHYNLSGYMHGRGHIYLNISLKSPYDEFDNWFNLIKKVFEFSSICIFLQYPQLKIDTFAKPDKEKIVELLSVDKKTSLMKVGVDLS